MSGNVVGELSCGDGSRQSVLRSFQNATIHGSPNRIEYIKKASMPALADQASSDWSSIMGTASDS
jgi:hypothetical protein